MSDEDLIERGASALFSAFNPGLRWDTHDATGSRNVYRYLARLALDAVRDPAIDHRATPRRVERRAGS